MTRVQLIGAVGVLGIALLAGAWFGGRAPAPPPVSFASVATSEAAPEPLTVHVAGAVRRPGLVELTPGARVADAVAGAGGVTGSADLARVNLAAAVTDGEQVVIPEVGEASISGGEAPAGDGRVRLNQADVARLQTLPGVGPVTAQRIVTHREANGPFGTIEDLLDVPGIGEGRLAALRDLVVVP